MSAAESGFVEQELSKAEKQGMYSRGSSPWGSWAFSTKPTGQRDPRVVVDFRRVNKTLVKAVCFIRRGDTTKSALCGSMFVTLGDGAKGFNLAKNTELAASVLAVLSESGCRLANVLQLGPVNGPFDFSFIMDELFALSPEHRRRLGRTWINYIDDWALRSGRFLEGR